MKTQRSFFIAFALLFFSVIFNSNSFGQDNTGSLDSKLTGVWQTDARDAVFQKIQFGDDGSFSGYTVASDSKPFATGTYQIKDNAIYVSASFSLSTMNSGEPVAVTYNFTNYSITKDAKLQFTPGGSKTSLIYSKPK